MKFKKIISISKEIIGLDKLTIFFDTSEEGKIKYKYFNSRHPRYLIIRNKTVGVAIIKTTDFTNEEGYLKSVNGKNSAAYFSRKALKAGYVFSELDPVKYSDAIYTINNSSNSRQGREMDSAYKKRDLVYPINNQNVYFGIFKGDDLVAYVWFVKSGELLLLNRVMGHANHLDFGVVYLLMTSAVQHCIKYYSEVKYAMYDTFFGASDGLKLFKKRCGFKPYKVVWKIK